MLVYYLLDRYRHTYRYFTLYYCYYSLLNLSLQMNAMYVLSLLMLVYCQLDRYKHTYRSVTFRNVTLVCANVALCRQVALCCIT
jgi:hypothetical protein